MAGDRELLEAWEAGDAKSGDQLVARYGDAVRRFFLNKVSQGAEALVQTTFTAARMRRQLLENKSSFRAYLFDTARNRLAAHFSGREREETVTDGGVVSTHALDPKAGADVAVKHDEQRIVLRGLRRIPLEFQMALELYYWEGMVGAELAEALDIPSGAVDGRLRKGQELLRKQLEKAGAPAEVLSGLLEDLDGWARSLRHQVHGRS